MTAANRTKPYSNNGGVIEYVKNLEMRNRTPFTINEQGKGFYVVAGELVEPKTFEALYPVQLVNRIKGERLDSRQNWF